MSKKHHKKSYPWQSPIRCFCFVFALIIAYFLTLNMPHKEYAIHADTSKTTIEEQQHLDSAKDILSKQEKSPANRKKMRHKMSAPKSDFDKIITKLKSISRLLLMVAIASFIGALMEARCWYRYFGASLVKLTQKAHLPEIIGLAMPIALYSSIGANSMLIASHEKGEIKTSALITGGMANSYLAHFSHSVRVMYPVIALVGIAGIGFFTIQLTGGFLLVLTAFYIHKKLNSFNNIKNTVQNTIELKEPKSWEQSIKQSLLRTCAILFRMVYITIPFMLGTEWIIKSGLLDFWEEAIPYQVAKYFPAELIAIVIAQIGGLIQSASVGANLLAENMVNHAQILLAMLVASAVGNPLRTLRRNLPTALGIFPVKVACTIVFSMQFARFFITILGSICVIWYLHN